MRQLLMRELHVDESQVYVGEWLLALGDLWFFAGLDRADLKDEPWSPITPPALQSADGPVDIFEAIRRGDILVHHPYDSFSASVEAFVEQAAGDPDVLAIKQTLYRTSSDSPIIQALIARRPGGQAGRGARGAEGAVRRAGEHHVREDAREGGRARRLRRRRAQDPREDLSRRTPGRHDGIRRYAHLGTGNYNPTTARLYEDLGLLTARPRSRRGPDRPLQPAHGLQPATRVPQAARRPRDDAARPRGADPPRDEPRRRLGRAEDEQPRRRPPDRRRSTRPRRRGCRSTCWSVASAACAPACPGSPSRSVRGRSLAGSSSTRGSIGSGARRAASTTYRLRRLDAAQPRSTGRGADPGRGRRAAATARRDPPGRPRRRRARMGARRRRRLAQGATRRAASTPIASSRSSRWSGRAAIGEARARGQGRRRARVQDARPLHARRTPARRGRRDRAVREHVPRHPRPPDHQVGCLSALPGRRGMDREAAAPAEAVEMLREEHTFDGPAARPPDGAVDLVRALVRGARVGRRRQGPDGATPHPGWWRPATVDPSPRSSTTRSRCSTGAGSWLGSARSRSRRRRRRWGSWRSPRSRARDRRRRRGHRPGARRWCGRSVRRPRHRPT